MRLMRIDLSNHNFCSYAQNLIAWNRAKKKKKRPITLLAHLPTRSAFRLIKVLREAKKNSANNFFHRDPQQEFNQQTADFQDTVDQDALCRESAHYKYPKWQNLEEIRDWEFVRL